MALAPDVSDDSSGPDERGDAPGGPLPVTNLDMEEDMSSDESKGLKPDPLVQRLLGHGNADGLKLVGGLVALVAGLLVLGLVAAGAFIADPAHAGSIATAAFGVIGPIVAAYFGVKIGSDGTQNAIEGARKAADAHQKEAAKVQVMAAHLPEGKAAEVLREAGLMAG